MNINFNDFTFEKLKYLADLEGRSVAALVSARMDELADQLVDATFSLNNIEENENELNYRDPQPHNIRKTEIGDKPPYYEGDSSIYKELP